VTHFKNDWLGRTANLSDLPSAATARANLGLAGLATADSPYAADSWDYTWAGADGSTGWTVTGSTAAVDTYQGKTAWHISGAVSAVTVRRSVTAPTGNFEFRANLYFEEVHASNGAPAYQLKFWAYGKVVNVVFTSTGFHLWDGASVYADGNTWKSGVALAQWVTVTVRCVATSATDGTLTFYAGEVPIGSCALSGGQTDAGSDGQFSFQRGGTGADQALGMAWLSYRAGLNAALPSYTYRGQGYAGGATA